MTKEKAKREFKKHYKRAMKLKEGGSAWEREIDQARRYLRIGKGLYENQLAERYGG